MLSLHESTQRRVCRVAFIVFCVAPTLWTMAWIAHFYRPWRNDDWQRVLSQQFHVQAKIEGIEKPRPGVTKLARVAIADLRSQQPLGVIETLQIERQSGRIALGAERLELSIEQLKAFTKTIETCFSATELPQFYFHANQLHVVGPEGKKFEFVNLRLRSVPGEAEKKQILLRADIKQSEAIATVQMELEGQGDNSVPVLQAKFDTQAAELPAWLVADLVPGVGSCIEATFTGKGILRSELAGSSGQLQGLFVDLDFKQWIGPLSPYQVQAQGRLKLNRVEWDADGVRLVQGQLQAGEGQIATGLIKQLEKVLYCESASAGTNSEGLQAFDQLNCNFEITSQGMTLTGNCDCVPNRTGCLMSLNSQPLLFQPKYTEIPPSRLALVLFPQAKSDWMPLVRQAIEVIQSLPITNLAPVPKTATREEAGAAKKVIK